MASSSPVQIPLDLIKSFSRPSKQDLNCYYSKAGCQIFEFQATWSVSDWYADENFGACRIDKLDTNHEYSSSLKVLGTGEFATVNKVFFERFKQIVSARLRTTVGKMSGQGRCVGW